MVGCLAAPDGCTRSRPHRAKIGHMSGASNSPGPSGLPSRRTVVLGLMAGFSTALSGCGVRFDSPPPPPPIPTRRKVTDEDLLIAIVRDTRAVRAAVTAAHPKSASGDKKLLGEVDALSRTQDQTLTGRLTNDGVPTAVIDGTGRPQPTGSASAGGSSSANPVDVKAVTAALTHVPDNLWKRLASASAGTRGVAWAAYSVRSAAAGLLGARPALPTASAARPGLAARTEALVYAFEVAAAHQSGEARKAALATLTPLRELVVELGEPPQTAGWSLPFEVTSAESATKLMRTVLAAAASAGVSLAGGSPDAAALADAAAWSGRIQALATSWGSPLTAFPGAAT